MTTEQPSTPAPSALPRLLIVDDEVAQMRALCDTLEETGYSTTGFASATAALKTLREREFDLLITDLMMPEMNGIELYRQARELRPHLVAVVTTGHGTIDTAVEAMKTGALDYILKPFKLSVIHAVVARALAVRQLRVDNEILNQRVKDRTAELEAANKELESFSFSVSHDLRAPLRGIGGYTGILLADYGDQVPPDAKVLLEKVASQTRLMQQLIQDLLEFSRLGRQRLASQIVDMDALVKAVLEELAPDREGRQLDLRVAPLPPTLGDYALLKQVLTNLLSNALKFTRGKSPAIIEIGFEDMGGEWEYFVKDNGAGFDMKYAGKLFGVFQRMHSNQDFEGTGIGLSIVQRILNRHGGKVRAEAKVGEGATFFFTLPKPGSDTPTASDTTPPI